MAAKKSGNAFPWVNLIGFSILALCYVAALFNVFRMKQEQADAAVIRIVHWQLELGVRDGLAEMITQFEAKKAAEGVEVKIIQIPMPENAYQQYVTTQMIGQTAPDMIQVGDKFPREFLGRYFLPLSEVLQLPNPYIAERVAELEGIGGETAAQWLEPTRKLVSLPWKDTFTDGLNSQYNEEVQEYFGVGFSQFTIRMFYNKDLFRAALGHDRPPRTYQELLEFGEKIRAYGEANGREIAPIASSKYQMGIFQNNFMASVTSDLFRDLDLSMDAWCVPDEITIAMLAGKWSPADPQHKAGSELLLELTQQFPRGFMSLGRMDAGFSFVQGNSAMITSGSWDAKSFFKNIEDQPEDQRFDVGIFKVPLIDETHPEYGQYFDGRVSEANTGTGFAFGITRNSKQVDLCTEFLQFCTSPENNTVVNEIAGWIPAVRGAETSELLRAFEPDFTGYWGIMNFNTGPRGLLLQTQLFWPYISGEIDYAEFSRRVMLDLPAESAIDYSRLYHEQKEAVPNRRARRAAYLASSTLSADPQKGIRDELKLLRSWDTLVNYELGQPRMRRQLDLARETGSETEFSKDFYTQYDREMQE